MKSKFLRALGIGAALLVPVGGLSLGFAGGAGASLPSTLTFGTGSSLHIFIGIIGLTMDLDQGTDGSDPVGSVAVSTTGGKYISTQTYVVPGNSAHTTMIFPAGTLKGRFTGSGITSVKIVTNGGGAPWMFFHTFTTGIQDCAIYNMQTIIYGGFAGTLNASSVSFNTNAFAGNAPGGTCRATLITYLDTYLLSATVFGTAQVS